MKWMRWHHQLTFEHQLQNLEERRERICIWVYVLDLSHRLEYLEGIKHKLDLLFEVLRALLLLDVFLLLQSRLAQIELR